MGHTDRNLLRRFSRYRLRSLLVLTTLVCLVLGIHVASYLRQKRAVDELNRHGLYVDYQWPHWMHRSRHLQRITVSAINLIGQDHFLTPVGIFAPDGHEVTAAALAGLKQLRRVESVGFDNTNATSHLFTRLGSCEHLTRISFFRKADAPTDHGYGLSRLQECIKLENLQLGDVNLPPGGLSFLRNCVQLEILHLSKCRGLHDDDISLILRLPHLRSLSLSGSEITDTGAKRLAAIQSLETLILGRTSISSDGWKHIGQMSQLKRLNLADTRLSDDVVKHLTGLTGLKTLHIGSTNISEEAALWLEDELMGRCIVYF